MIHIQRFFGGTNMRVFYFALIILFSIGFISAAEVAEGQDAPDFSLPGSDGTTYTLSQFKGVKPVIIAWYPKAFTGG
jgi:peroxiredoxin Q/BCP